MLTNLKLQSFRNYSKLDLGQAHPNLNLVIGANGAGKTNILEAISLLSPGRGFRNTTLGDFQCHNDQTLPWGIGAQINDRLDQSHNIKIIFNPEKGKQNLVLNETAHHHKSIWSEIVTVNWYIPAYDRFFMEAPGKRRRFFDRFVASSEPDHSTRLTKYEKAMAERSKVLQQGRPDPKWISALESEMIAHGIALCASRLQHLETLQQFLDNMHTEYKMTLQLSGLIENALAKGKTALECECLLADALQNSRERDTLTGGAHIGPHKTDFTAYDLNKNQAAAMGSTGEQKSNVLTMILAQSCFLKSKYGHSPIVLLDEFAAHFDSTRCNKILESFLTLGAQCWITGQAETGFSNFTDKAVFRIDDGVLQ